MVITLQQEKTNNLLGTRKKNLMHCNCFRKEGAFVKMIVNINLMHVIYKTSSRNSNTTPKLHIHSHFNLYLYLQRLNGSIISLTQGSASLRSFPPIPSGHRIGNAAQAAKM